MKLARTSVAKDLQASWLQEHKPGAKRWPDHWGLERDFGDAPARSLSETALLAQRLAAAIASQSQAHAIHSRLNERLSAVEAAIERLNSKEIFEATVDTIHDEGVKLLSPIRLVVEISDEQAVAHYLPGKVSATGDNFGEAVENLKSLLVDTFLFLESDQAGSLSSFLESQRAALRGVLSRSHA